jgi:hypothetical protein
MAAECHARAVREFPDYELLAVKQKMGKVAFQGVPSAMGAGSSDASLRPRYRRLLTQRRAR